MKPKPNNKPAAEPRPERVRTIQDLRDAAARYRGEYPDEPEAETEREADFDPYEDSDTAREADE